MEVNSFNVRHYFRGTGILFAVRPNTWKRIPYEIHCSETDSTIAFDIKLYKRNREEFTREKSKFYETAFTNLEYINKVPEQWNQSLSNLMSLLFHSLKTMYLEENKFFEAIDIKGNKGTKSIFAEPTVKRGIIPQPNGSSKKEFSSETPMGNEMYNDILKVTYDAGKNMEKKPPLYQNKDEKGLRDQFLFML